MAAVQGAGQIAGHQQQKAGVKARNRQRLKQFEYDNQNYLNEVKLNNAQYFNDTVASEVEQEGIFKAMVDQWNQIDKQLDEMYAKSSFKLQDQLIKMYKNEYAGTQTGRTAGRLAAASAKKKGFEMAKELNSLLLKQEEATLKQDASRTDAMSKIDKLYEKVRFPPQHGHTPVPPELEAKPSNASLILGLAGTALSAYGFHKATAAKGTGMTGAANHDAFVDITSAGYSLDDAITLQSGGSIETVIGP
tara:strand:- start:279 stop:1022 length:744 start_codon:yes stop_codon:yes gene_type:complete